MVDKWRWDEVPNQLKTENGRKGSPPQKINRDSSLNKNQQLRDGSIKTRPTTKFNRAVSESNKKDTNSSTGSYNNSIDKAK